MIMTKSQYKQFAKQFTWSMLNILQNTNMFPEEICEIKAITLSKMVSKQRYTYMAYGIDLSQCVSFSQLDMLSVSDAIKRLLPKSIVTKIFVSVDGKVFRFYVEFVGSANTCEIELTIS